MSNKIFTIKFPLEIGIDDVGFKSISSLNETVKYNLKSTLLTSPGEIISDPDFGVGLHKMLFELPTLQNLQTVRNRIISQITSYLPYLNLNTVNLNVSEDNNELSITIKYKISTSQSVETFNFSINLTDI